VAQNMERNDPNRAQHPVRHPHRLEAGQVYFDLDHPENGPFTATGDEQVAPGSNIVSQDDMSEESWEQLVSAGWGETRPEARGDRAYDQGAFGEETNPREDTLNAAPPGVGKGFTPKAPGEEHRR
jgi:hypothetical protein